MEDSGVASLMHSLAQPSWDGSFLELILLIQVNLHTVPSQKVPLWTGLSVSFMEWSHLDKSLGTYVHLGLVNKTRYHSPGCPLYFLCRVLPPNAITYINIQSLVFCCCVVRQLARYQKVNHVMAVSQQKHVALQLTFKSDIVWLTTAYRCV